MIVMNNIDEMVGVYPPIETIPDYNSELHTFGLTDGSEEPCLVMYAMVWITVSGYKFGTSTVNFRKTKIRLTE